MLLCSFFVPLAFAFIRVTLSLMTPATQGWLQVAVLLAGIAGTLVAAIVYQTHYIDKRIEDLRTYVDGRFQAADERLVALEKRLIEKIDGLEKRVIERLDHLEHPVSRP
jgi:hypothetical protein